MLRVEPTQLVQPFPEDVENLAELLYRVTRGCRLHGARHALVIDTLGRTARAVSRILEISRVVYVDTRGEVMTVNGAAPEGGARAAAVDFAMWCRQRGIDGLSIDGNFRREDLYEAFAWLDDNSPEQIRLALSGCHAPYLTEGGFIFNPLLGHGMTDRAPKSATDPVTAPTEPVNLVDFSQGDGWAESEQPEESPSEPAPPPEETPESPAPIAGRPKDVLAAAALPTPAQLAEVLPGWLRDQRAETLAAVEALLERDGVRPATLDAVVGQLVQTLGEEAAPLLRRIYTERPLFRKQLRFSEAVRLAVTEALGSILLPWVEPLLQLASKDSRRSVRDKAAEVQDAAAATVGFTVPRAPG